MISPCHEASRATHDPDRQYRGSKQAAPIIRRRLDALSNGGWNAWSERKSEQFDREQGPLGVYVHGVGGELFGRDDLYLGRHEICREVTEIVDDDGASVPHDGGGNDVFVVGVGQTIGSFKWFPALLFGQVRSCDSLVRGGKRRQPDQLNG